MQKYTVTITETVAYEMEVEAVDAEAAEQHAKHVFQQNGHSTVEFVGVLERTYEVEELT